MKRKGWRWDLETMPGWMMAWIEEAGIPLEFDEDTLTEEQISHLNLLTVVEELVEKGHLRVVYELGEGVKVYLTEKGERFTEELVRRLRR